MEITYLGRSCFKIRGKQATVITDPFSPELGYTMGKQTADIVTVSHSHKDHSYTQGINGTPRILNRPGEYEAAGVLVIGLPSYHDREKGAERGNNIIFVMEMEEVSICHMGDLGHPLTDAQVEEIGKVDVLMIPVGGVYTINAQQAAATMRQLEPRIVLPMHYQAGLFSADLEPLDNFLRETSVQSQTPQSKLNVTKSNLPLTQQILQLDFQSPR
jgi:L-ascorbate metabolism protein UlaG (beta-lactamase superfamily)